MLRYLSVNGCSMKTPENLRTVKAIRPDKIMFETGNLLIPSDQHMFS